ncbi:MAG TPA: hypothetical protein VJZ91_07355, partial [Blastocatellia bacterium]|nr:hypothetical protein [Blastocatellia bacterium]
MFNSPYMQSSADQFVDLLGRLIEVYTTTLLVIGALLLVLTVWLCVSELRQSKRAARTGRRLPATPPRRAAARRLLEESLF